MDCLGRYADMIPEHYLLQECARIAEIEYEIRPKSKAHSQSIWSLFTSFSTANIFGLLKCNRWLFDSISNRAEAIDML